MDQESKKQQARQATSVPKHCGRPMWNVKDRPSNAPIWWCPECHHKLPREEGVNE